MAKRNRKDITRRNFIKTGIAGTAALSASGFLKGCAPSFLKKQPPNILFIMTDQQHLDTIAHLGCSYVQTPAMDQLATNGTSFRESYVTHPVCLPCRASIFTGRMPSETGINRKKPALRPELPTLGSWIAEHSNYTTIYAGKWHVPKYIPSKHDDVPGFRTIATGISGQGFMMDTHVALACESYIRNYSAQNPFFLVASFMNPHDICEWQFLNTANQKKLRFPELAGELPPLPSNFNYPQEEPEFIKNFRLTLDPHVGYWEELHWRYYLWSYYRHIEMVDGEIGRLLNALRDTGRDKNTLIILTSDHGEGLGHHQMTHKLFPYDEVCRVPFIVSFPDTLPADKVNSSSLISGLDIMPTICDFAQTPIPSGMKGISLRQLLQNGTEPDRQYVPVEIVGNRGKMIRSRRYKYVKFENDSVEMLFDMQEDPGETKNVATDANFTAVLEDHRKLLQDWISKLDIVKD